MPNPIPSVRFHSRPRKQKRERERERERKGGSKAGEGASGETLEYKLRNGAVSPKVAS